MIERFRVRGAQTNRDRDWGLRVLHAAPVRCRLMPNYHDIKVDRLRNIFFHNTYLFEGFHNESMLKILSNLFRIL